MLAMLSLLTWPHSPFGNWSRKPRPACGFAPPTTDARWNKKRVRSCAPLWPPPLGPTETWPRRFAAGLRRLAESRSPYRSATPCARPPTRQSLRSLKPHRAELARGESFQSAEACVEFGGREAPEAVEGAQEIPCRAVALAPGAFGTGGNQVAEGMSAQAPPRHHVAQHPHMRGT